MYKHHPKIFAFLFFLMLTTNAFIKTSAQCVHFVKALQGIALKSDGTIWTFNDTSTTQIGSDNDWIDIEGVSSSFCALKKDGTRWVKGLNSVERLGVPYLFSTDTLLKTTTDSNWSSISMGNHHGIGIKKDGSLWAWGNNSDGQIGVGNYLPGFIQPIQVGSDTNWKTVKAGGQCSFAIKNDGSLWAWGYNGFYALGDSNIATKWTPYPIDTSKKWKEVSSSGMHTIGIRQDGSLWVWGNNDYGQLGIARYTSFFKKHPTKLGTDTNWNHISAGLYFTLAINKNGELWGLGSCESGALGLGTYLRYDSPQLIDSTKKWTSVSAQGKSSYAMQSDSSLWSCGQWGTLGYRTTKNNIFQKMYGKPTIIGNTKICLGNSEILSSTDTPFTVKPWHSSDTSIATVSDSGLVRGIKSGTCIITYKNKDGCEGNVVVTIHKLPTIVGKMKACIGDSVLLSSSDTSALSAWYVSDDALAKISPKGIIKAKASGDVVITRIDSNSCMQTDTFIVLKMTAPPKVISPIDYCQNSTSDTLSAIGTMIKWYDSDTSTTYSTSAPLPSTSLVAVVNYFVSQTDTSNGCESTKNIISVNTNPQPASPILISPIVYCQDARTDSLTATGTNLKWYANDTTKITSPIAPLPDSKTPGSISYFVSQSNSFACESKRDSIVVIINPRPLPPEVITPINLCLKSNADSLTAIGTNLKWYLSPTDTTALAFAPIPVTNNIDSFSYFVTQANIYECISEKSEIRIIIKALPEIELRSMSPSALVICKNDSINLKCFTNSPNTFEWRYNNKLLPDQTKENLYANSEGLYLVEITDSNNCTNRDSLIVIQDKSLSPTLTPFFSEICKGKAIVLTALPKDSIWTYQWFHNNIQIDTIATDVNIARFNQTGNYYVKTINSNGCREITNNVEIVVFETLKPKIALSNRIASVANSFFSYQWYRNGEIIKHAVSNKLKLENSAQYHVETIDANGCFMQSDTIDFFYNPLFFNQIKIYPNPTKSLLNIETDLKVNVSITDILGSQLLFKTEVSQVNLAPFPNGIYLLKVFDENNQLLMVEKIVKQE